MKIILEGPDNSGKSTLAKYLNEFLGFTLIHSGGPSKYPGEVVERSKRFNEMKGPIIFDRHPCVSQNLYAEALGEGERVPEDVIAEFMGQKPFIIYCRNEGSLDGHQMSEHSSPEYFDKVQENLLRLCKDYDEWALSNANMVYRIGDSMKDLVLIVGDKVWGSAGDYEFFDPVQDIEDFHRKFGQHYGGLPRLLPTALADFRYEFLWEELSEYNESQDDGQRFLGQGDLAGVQQELEVQLDSLVDLVYVALGTAHLQGFNFREAWRRVHAANMKKVRAQVGGVDTENVKDSGRPKQFDVVKPEGWESPCHKDLVENHAHQVRSE